MDVYYEGQYIPKLINNNTILFYPRPIQSIVYAIFEFVLNRLIITPYCNVPEIAFWNQFQLEISQVDYIITLFSFLNVFCFDSFDSRLYVFMSCYHYVLIIIL